MIDYLATFANTNGIAFPGTKGKNASAPTATDGTEFIAKMIDDLWGFNQALMDYASLTPDGVDEAPGTSQRIDAIRKGFAVGPGMGVTYWKDGDPATNGDRVLLLQGQGVLISSFPLLDAAVYVGDGNNGTASSFYHAQDAAGTIRDTAGPFLILPDTRGYSLRGLDLSGTVDPDGASRDLGSIQQDDFESHSHSSGGDTNFTASGSQTSFVGHVTAGGVTYTIGSTGGAETRGKNVATNYGITY